MLAALVLTGCGDDTMDPTDAGVDAGEVIVDDAGPPPECGNDEVETGEVCDDGNTVGGDGCSAACDSDETCGNGVLELDEACDDGNTMSGDGCSAGCDSDESCGNGVTDLGVGEICDDGNTTGDDGCSADCTSVESCGDGAVDPGEECDDGNTTDGDGCDSECRLQTCTGDADCDDGNPCNGTETCGSTMVCESGTPIAEGDACGSGAGRDICVGGACVTSACGDGYVDTGATPAEQCDDFDTDDGDGCDSTCQLEMCTVDGDCDDGNECTNGHSCGGGTCVLGTAVGDGTLCEADTSPGTRDICLGGRCLQSRCGDGYVDTGEECDDGNTMSGDGCDASCTIPSVPITAFRVTSLELVDPHFYAELGPSCNDITETVNTLITSSIRDYSLNALGLFQPLNLARGTNPTEIVFGGSCMPGTPDRCQIGTGSTVATTANNMLPAAAVCLAPDASRLNPSYSGTVNTASGPCFVTDEQTFAVDFGAALINLSAAQMAGTYVGGSTPSRVVNGVIVGFLSETEAQSITFDATLPLVGGDTMYEHLAANRAPGSACETVAGFDVDDRDTFAGESGFWFYMNFEAERVDWTP